MTTIKILGEPSAQMRQLRDNVDRALGAFPLGSTVQEVCEPNGIAASGVTATPALMLDGIVVAAGQVPSVQEVQNFIENRYLLKSKLYQIRTITVPVDLSPAAEQALLYAYSLATALDVDELEVLYVMDSIFEGERPSSSGFLSGYKKTMQLELDAFVGRTLAQIGINYPPGATPGAPGRAQGPAPAPRLRSLVRYGFPDTSIIEYSKNTDLIVMSTTGRGSLGRKLFGSISLEVSKQAHAPVLLIPPNCRYASFDNILYGSNFESLDPERIRQAVAFSGRFDAQLHFVHVGKPGEKGVELEQKLFEIHYRQTEPQRPFIFSSMVGDNIVEQLYEYSLTRHVDLLVFVTQQRSFWENIVHHSITRDVLFDAFTPVLILHAEGD
jgi:nucleotide-binding universal stress UspA family protein